MDGSSYGNGLSTDQLNAQAFLSLGAYDYEYDLGLIFFGLHLIALGYLAFKSGYLSDFGELCWESCSHRWRGVLHR